jgi:hypothetical protein
MRKLRRPVRPAVFSNVWTVGDDGVPPTTVLRLAVQAFQMATRTLLQPFLTRGLSKIELQRIVMLLRPRQVSIRHTSARIPEIGTGVPAHRWLAHGLTRQPRLLPKDRL